MLRFLSIRNLAVIDRLELEFQPGLNVLTGETGAGKSILVGAVGLLVGGRASADPARAGEDTATRPAGPPVRPANPSPRCCSIRRRTSISSTSSRDWRPSATRSPRRSVRGNR